MITSEEIKSLTSKEIKLLNAILKHLQLQVDIKNDRNFKPSQINKFLKVDTVTANGLLETLENHKLITIYHGDMAHFEEDGTNFLNMKGGYKKENPKWLTKGFYIEEIAKHYLLFILGLITVGFISFFNGINCNSKTNNKSIQQESKQLTDTAKATKP